MDNNNENKNTVRGLIEFLRKNNEILITDKEIDPICEPAGINKALEDGPAALFNNIKGYPGHRYLINLFGRKDRTSAIFGVSDPKNFKYRINEAIKNQIKPKLVDQAKCQEVIHTKNLDIFKILPVTKSIETDPGRVITGGISFFSVPDFGNCISFRRTHFRGKDWASISIIPESHMERYFGQTAKKGKFPFTLNITCPASVMTVAAAGMCQMAIPQGSDELGIAGGLQNAPVEICRAKTVDAYAIADAEYIIEGYLDTSKIVWESDESEKEQKDFVSPFLNEWRGYLGWAHTTYTFEATAVTHKKNNPIYYATTAGLFDEQSRISPFTEAALLDLANKMCPGLVQDVHIPHCMKGQLGAIFQVKKRRKNDNRFSKSLIPLTFCSVSPMQFVVVVDEDVNIYNADDILWALTTRITEQESIVDFNMGKVAPRSGISKKTGIDATIPFELKSTWIRSVYPKVNLEKWFPLNEIEMIVKRKSEYARFMSEFRR